MPKKKLYLIVGIAAFVVVICLPSIVSRFQLRIATEIIVFSLVVMTWKTMLNEGGLFSFGHAAYFGLGAYAAVLGWINIEGLSFLNGLLLGGLFAGFVSLFLGVFLVRLSGTYFALLTLALNQLIWAIAWKWRSVTGGDDGLGRFPRPDMMGISMQDPVNFYYVSLIIVGICFFLFWYLSKTPLGNVLRSIKSNGERARFIGFNVNASKLILLTIGGFFAGIAGALFAQFQGFLATSVIDLHTSTSIAFMSFIGGVGSFWGPLAGAAFYTYMSEYLCRITERWEFIYGAIFIVIVLYAPQGLLGLLKKKR